MNDNIEIKWPWEMVWMEHVGDFIEWIKASLPPDHELQDHKLFPGIKWHRRSIFIVLENGIRLNRSASLSHMCAMFSGRTVILTCFSPSESPQACCSWSSLRITSPIFWE
jgi:hypothetical protein